MRLRVETTALGVLLALRAHLGLQHDRDFRLFEHSAPGAEGVFKALDEDMKVSRVIQRWPQESAASGPRRLVFRRGMRGDPHENARGGGAADGGAVSPGDAGAKLVDGGDLPLGHAADQGVHLARRGDGAGA